MGVGIYAGFLVDGVVGALGRAVSDSSVGMGVGGKVGNGKGGRKGGLKLKRVVGGSASGSGVMTPKVGGGGGGVRGVGGRFLSRKAGVDASMAGPGIGLSVNGETDERGMGNKKRKIEIEFSVSVNIREVFSDGEEEGEDLRIRDGNANSNSNATSKLTSTYQTPNQSSTTQPTNHTEMDIEPNPAVAPTRAYQRSTTSQGQKEAGGEGEEEEVLVLKTDGLLLGSSGGGTSGGGISQEGGEEIFSPGKRSVSELDFEIEESPPKRCK